ncbi:MAG: DUF4837 family protein [Massilibacteroides sp.]|nr:DUF4837 family protein [Massilibacteroides sp.]MDD4660634.1 DUF4837 family protein [Massilibacteroides sp.]
MKTHLLIVQLLSLSLFFAGCNSSGLVLPQGTGWPYEAVVVMEQKYWNNEVGEAVKDELGASIFGLPQPEPAIKMTKVTPEVFDGILHYAKNILLVNVNPSLYTKVSVKHEINRWAQNQVVLMMNAPDKESIVQYLKDRKGVLVNFLTRSEMERSFQLLEKNYSKSMMEKLQAKFDIKLNIPSEMTFFRDTTDFFWTSNNANSGRTDVMVYTFPYTDPQTFTINYLVNKRDSVLRENIPGAYPNSYMATELRDGLDYKPISHLGKYAGVMRGLWKMVGDMMGGPFISLVRVDEANNRIVVVESFVYAPGTEKRNLIRRGESILYTLRLPGEFDIPVTKSLTTDQEQLKSKEDGE